MRPQPRKEAIMFYAMIALILFVAMYAKMAHACDSYEDCMKEASRPDASIEVFNGHTFKLPYDLKTLEVFYLKAIAYKLDEISKKLGETEKTDNQRHIWLNGGGCSWDVKNNKAICPQ